MSFKPNKILSVFLCYLSLMIVEACCSCPEPDLPYFEYHLVHVETFKPSRYSTEFGFAIAFDSIEFVAKNDNQPLGITFLTNSAYACDCMPPGNEVKYDITQINIYPDSIFTDLIDQDQSISSLFRITTWYNPDKGYQSERLDSLSNKPWKIPGFKGDEVNFFSTVKPVKVNRPYFFEIEIVKENGEILRASSDPIIWEE